MVAREFWIPVVDEKGYRDGVGVQQLEHGDFDGRVLVGED